MVRHSAAASVVLALMVSPAAAVGQQVQGSVVDADEGTPVAGVTVTLVDSAGEVLRRVVATDQGRFRVSHDRAGLYRLVAERIGYAAVEGEPIRLDSAQVVEVEVRMRAEAVPVDPIRVLGRRDVQKGTPDEFFDRMERLGDRGHFLTRQQIEASGARLPSAALAWAPGTWISPNGLFNNTISLMSFGRACSPAIYLNGLALPSGFGLDDLVMVDRIEGIEVYRGHYTPDTYARSLESWGCGVVLVWTRTDHDPRFAFSWGRTMMLGALGGLLFGLQALFF